MKRAIYIIGLTIVGGTICWWLFSDDYDRSKPTEFYKILEDKDSIACYEVYVVHNAPYDTLEIKMVIEQFNIRTLPIDSILNYKICGRVFYRETKYMTRNFKEGEEYNPQYSSWDNTKDFRNHYKDIMMNTRYFINPANNGKSYYYYWLNWGNGNHWENSTSKSVKTTFHDIESLYRAKKKEYGIK
jgi:hypothetical protein